MRVYGVIGWKNAGKTTLVERLVGEIASRGYTVSTVKHTHHKVDVDRPGKDSHRHRKAGAHQVILASSARWALMTELRGQPETPLRQLLRHLHPVDLVIVEGYKRDAHAKIEVRNVELDHPRLAGDDPSVVAIAANGPVAEAPVPVFSRDDIAALADFVCGRAGLEGGRR